jgi:hypothetical protein
MMASNFSGLGAFAAAMLGKNGRLSSGSSVIYSIILKNYKTASSTG